MIYDESSRTLETAQLARLMFRRNMEAAMLAALAGGLASAIAVPMRFPMERVPAPILTVIVIAAVGLVALLEVLLFFLRRSPPNAAIERFSRVIESKRQAGGRVAALSRMFIALTGTLAFVLALAVVMLIPVE